MREHLRVTYRVEKRTYSLETLGTGTSTDKQTRRKGLKINGVTYKKVN